MKTLLATFGFLCCWVPSVALCANNFSVSGTSQGNPGDAVEVVLDGQTDVAMKGYSIAFVYDSRVFEFVSSTLDGTRGQGAQIFTSGHTDTTATAGVVYSFSCPPSIPAGTGPLLKVTLQIHSDAPIGPTYLDLRDVNPSLNRITPCSGPTIAPTLTDGTFEVLGQIPVCDVRPTSLDFDSVEVGGSADRSFRIKNTGGGTLTGDVSETCQDYSIVSGSGIYALDLGESLSVVVRFAPTTTGLKNCTVANGSALCSDVYCTGTGFSTAGCSESQPLEVPVLEVSNPYRPNGQILLRTRGGHFANVSIYGVDGRRTRSLFRGPLASGVAEFLWNGRTDEGRELGCGIYYVHGEVDGRRFSKRILLIR